MPPVVMPVVIGWIDEKVEIITSWDFLVGDPLAFSDGLLPDRVGIVVRVLPFPAVLNNAAVQWQKDCQ